MLAGSALLLDLAAHPRLLPCRFVASFYALNDDSFRGFASSC
jgi:hypothetical protein